MSYEGISQRMCKAGHLHEYDALSLAHDEVVLEGEPEPEPWKCPETGCGLGLAWRNEIDETNGADPDTGRCPGHVDLEIAEEVRCTCKCGNIHLVKPIRYKIPTKGA